MLLLFLGAAGVLAQAEAQASIDLAATVSATGLRFVDGVRYTVTALPPPGATIQGLVAEITLPAGAELVEAFDSDQLMFRGARAGASGESLIWTIEALEPNQPLGPFAFTLREPVTGPLSVFMQWATTDPNLIGVISTFAVPELREAANDIDSLMVSTAGTGDLTPVGATGVLLHVAAGVVSEDTPVLVGEMPTDLNPPPEYGAIWWCSGLAMAGLPEGAQADVLVPLRRPLPPLTTTTLFALQPDNTWLPLEQRGVISFDGQYVAYTHPGGVIATGVDGDLQPAEQPPFDVPPAEAPPPAPPPAEPPPPMEPPPPQPALEAVIPVNPPPVEPPPTAAAVPTVESVPAEAPPTGGPLEAPINVPPTLIAPLADITGGSGQVGRPPIPTPAFTRELIQIVPTPPPVALENITDGTSNTILLGEATRVPDQVVLPTAARGGITDGTSNTILLGEATRVPDQFALPTAALGGITDGTSNTILFGEATGTPDQVAPPTATLGGITDGTSNTILLGEATGTPDQVAPPTAALGGIAAGTSNTILLGEATRVPDQFAPPTATLGGITDGSSNTILLGEATRVPDQFAPPTATLGGITDGSSNTILLGEATRSPGDGGVRPVNLTPTPLPDQVAPPTAALGGITDGTSNTILLGEATRAPGDSGVRPVNLTPTPLPDQVAPPTAALGGITDGTSNTILLGEATRAPDQFAPPTATLGGITDGTSNTILLGEATGTPDQVTLPTATLGGINDGTSNTILLGEATGTPIPPGDITLADVVATLLASSATAVVRDDVATFTSTPSLDQMTPTATPVLDARGTPIVVGDTRAGGEDQLSIVQRARDQVQQNSGVTSGVALGAIQQAFPQLGEGAPQAEATAPAATRTATPSPVPSLQATNQMAALTPVPATAPTTTATLLPAPVIVTAGRVAACAPVSQQRVGSAAPCLTAANTIEVCAPGANACLLLTLRQPQVCIRFAGRRTPVCTRFGR